jgi:hypothetical protein
MCTPRTPRDPLPKIGESPDSAERDGGDETPQRKHEEEWESLELRARRRGARTQRRRALLTRRTMAPAWGRAPPTQPPTTG